jgi:prepilin-type processing-associated H-X9-DG protein
LAHPIRPQDFTDGSSTTVAMAEWIIRPTRNSSSSPKKAAFASLSSIASRTDYETFLARCHQHQSPDLKPIFTSIGMTWLSRSVGMTLYNHALTINSYSCINSKSYQYSAFTASSWHADGANVLYADGHVAFAKQSLSSSTWKALGTRNGGESISMDVL